MTTPTPQREERRSIWRVGPDSSWTTVLPVTFIIVSLLSLVILPLAVSNHTKKMRGEITNVAEPARVAANDMQVKLSSELDRIIFFQVTGQQHYAREYAQLVREQQDNRVKLAKLTPQLDPDTDQSLANLITATEKWHNDVLSSELLQRQLPPEVFQTRLLDHL